MRYIVILSLLLLTLASVKSHSVLKVPAAWNPSPSKSAQCGGGSPQNSPQATYCPGRTYDLTWQVVIGDGVGEVSVGINLNTKATDTFTNLAKFQGANAVGTFTIQVTMPASECTLCTLQAFSVSDWYSCTTITLSNDACAAGGVTAVPLTPVKVDNELKFCTIKNKKTVMVAAGTVLKDLDDATKKTFNDNLANINVFGKNDTNCRQLYYPFLCEVAFPQAEGSFNETVTAANSLTQQECEAFSSACEVTELHSQLYPCSSFPVDESSATSVVASLALVIVSLIATTLFF